MNPYQWLGIDPQIKNPNHFQLLGIKSLVADEGEFVKQVKQCVQKKLGQLDRPELAAHAEIVGKLKQRIKVAGAILTDSAKRTQYVAQLKSTSQDSQTPHRSSTQGLSATAAVVDSARKSPSDNLASKNVEEIPFAIPMRKADGFSKPVQPAAKPASKQTVPELRIADEFVDDSPGDGSRREDSPLGGAILKTKRTRRRNSPMMMVCGSLVVIAAMAGLAYLAFLLSQPRSQEIAKATNPIEEVIQDQTQTEKTESKTELKSDIDRAQPTSAVTQPETLPEAASVNSSESKIESGISPPAETKKADDLGMDPFDDVPAGSETMPEKATPTPEQQSIPSETSNDPEPINPDDPDDPATAPTKSELPENVWETLPGVDLLTLSEPEQYIIDKSLRRIQFRQQLRDAEAAENQMEELLEYLDVVYFRKFPGKVSPYQRIAVALNDINHRLRGFWDQFEASASAMPAGQEIIVFERPLSFVEYSNSQLVMREQGFSIRYQRENIPAELAVKIAEQGAIEDVPTWRFFLAAFLATQPDGHIRNKEQITEMIELSVEDGHDASKFRDYLTYRSDPRPVKLKAEIPDVNASAAVTRKVWEHAEAQIGEHVNEFSPAELHNFWMGWEVFWFSYVQGSGNLELEKEKPLIHSSLILVNNAIRVATNGQEADRLVEAIAELGYLTGQNTDKILVENLAEIAVKKLDLRQSIELKRVAEPVIERVSEDKKLRPIANRVKKRLQTLERLHKINGTGQTFGALR